VFDPFPEFASAGAVCSVGFILKVISVAFVVFFESLVTIPAEFTLAHSVARAEILFLKLSTRSAEMGILGENGRA